MTPHTFRTMALQAMADAEGVNYNAKPTRQTRPLSSPGVELIQEEVHAHLSKYGYVPGQYDIRPCPPSFVDCELQPWHQQLLQVGKRRCLSLCT